MRLYVVSYAYFESLRAHVNMVYHSRNVYVNSKAVFYFVNDFAVNVSPSEPYLYGTKYDPSSFSVSLSDSVLKTWKHAVDMSGNIEPVYFFPDTPWYRDFVPVLHRRLTGARRSPAAIFCGKLRYDSEEWRGLLSESVNPPPGKRYEDALERMKRRKWIYDETRNRFSARSTIGDPVTPSVILSDSYFASGGRSEAIFSVSDGYGTAYAYASGSFYGPYGIENLYAFMDAEFDNDSYEFGWPFAEKDTFSDNASGLFTIGAEPPETLPFEPSGKRPSEVFRMPGSGNWSVSESVYGSIFVYERSDWSDETDGIVGYRGVGLDSGTYSGLVTEFLSGDSDGSGIVDFIASYVSDASPLYKGCPQCGEGKIYAATGSFYCDSCELTIVKAIHRRLFGIELRKRDVYSLLRRGSAMIMKKGVPTRFILKGNGKWWKAVPVTT